MDEPVEDPEREGALAGLIEVETRVLEAIREAEAEAERAVAEVEAELDVDASAEGRTLDAALSELRAQLEAQRVEALADIERASAADARRYHGVDDARVDTLAAHVVRRIAEDELGAGPRDEPPRRAPSLEDEARERPS